MQPSGNCQLPTNQLLLLMFENSWQLKYFSSERYSPKCSAKRIAESFPEGSINPYRSCLTVRLSFSLSYAVVPLIFAARLLTLILTQSRSICALSIISQTVKNVMILVSDATSLFKVSFLPMIMLAAFISYIAYDWAEMLGRENGDRSQEALQSEPDFLLFLLIFSNLWELPLSY